MWSLLGAAFLLILFFDTNQSCDVSNLISFIQDIRTCNNSILTISFNFTNATCANYEYQIELIHLHTQQIKYSTQDPKPFLYNGTNICHISLTLTDNVTAEEYYNSSLHVRVEKYPACFISNNFTVLVDKDPPGPFLTKSVVYCNEVYLFWSPPLSPPACPIKSYQIRFNDSTIITNKTYHHFTELPASQRMFVSVGATNDIGTSWNSTLITTAIAPNVSKVNHTVELIQINSTSLNVSLSITAKVFTHCLYSLPTHINLSLSCDDDIYYHSIISSIVSANGLIEYNYKGISIDMLHCTAKAMWYNLNSSTTEYTFTFNTSQVYMQLFPVSNGLNYTCYYREHSIVWGCGISVNNNASNATQRNGKTVTEGYLNGLCPGTSYNVTYYVLSSKDSKLVIGSMNVSVNGSICTLPTSPGTGGVGERSHMMTYVAVIVSVVLIVTLLVVIICVMIWLCVKKKRSKASRLARKDETMVFDGTTVHGQDNEPVGKAFRTDAQFDSTDSCNDDSEHVKVTVSPPQPSHPIQDSSETRPYSPTRRESSDQGELHFARSSNQPVSFTRGSASELTVYQRQGSQQSNKSSNSLSRIASKISQKVSSIASHLSFQSRGSGYQQLSQENDNELSIIHSEGLHDPGDVPPSTDTGVNFMIGGGGEDNEY